MNTATLARPDPIAAEHERLASEWRPKLQAFITANTKSTFSNWEERQSVTTNKAMAERALARINQRWLLSGLQAGWSERSLLGDSGLLPAEWVLSIGNLVADEVYHNNPRLGDLRQTATGTLSNVSRHTFGGSLDWADIKADTSPPLVGGRWQVRWHQRAKRIEFFTPRTAGPESTLLADEINTHKFLQLVFGVVSEDEAVAIAADWTDRLQA
ncbi:MAG: hypothetical protein JSS20_16635, partial [Proteobacteria bacterium]|nr:hypothetical protein [Pseudomonadota bacterium]